MKVKIFKSINFDKLEEYINYFINLYKDLEIVSISHSSVWIPSNPSTFHEAHVLYTAILIYK